MIRGTNRFLAAFGLATILWTSAAAGATAGDEAGRPVFRNFRPTEYRGHPQVYSVATVPSGLVYLSSEQGIIEYDGIRWRHLPAPTSQIFAVEAGPDGRIWIGGMDEVGYYFPETAGQPGYHSITASLPAELRQPGRIRSLAVRADGTYYSTRGYIFRWREGGVRSWKIGTRPAKLHSLGDTLYAHVSGAGLLRLEGDEFKPVSNLPAFVRTNDSALFSLNAARLLAVIPGEGFLEIDSTTGAATDWSTPAAALIRSAGSVAGVRLRDGSFALGTQPLGLLVVSADGTRVRRLDRTTGLVDNVILSLTPDSAGGLWVGFNTGAARVELDSPVSVFDGDNGPPAGTIDCWGRHEGVLYAGAYDGLWRLTPGDPATGAGARFVKDPRAITNVFAIEPYEGETLVAGARGLHRLGPATVERLVDTADNSPLCLILSRTTPGRIYLGGLRGLTVAQKTPAGWTKLAEYLELGDVHTAAEEADGTLWLATYSRGFWQIPRAGQITDWKGVPPRPFFKNCGLPDAIAWTAVFDTPGGASLFTDKGSFRLDPTGTRCTPDQRFLLPGEPRTAVYPFVRAANGDGWATLYTASTLETNYPLGRFTASPDGETWRPAPAAALSEIGFAGAAVMALDRTPAGEEVIWARGYHNTVRLVLGRDAPAPPTWRALIRGLVAAGHLRLPFSRDALTFDLAAPSHGAGGEVRFSTRLLGYSDKWSPPTTHPEVVFTNLIGGPFTLEVQAQNAEGRISELATLTFSISPPWHRTPGAYTFYGLVAAGLVMGFVRWRLGRAERERRRLETLVATRTAELATARDAAESANRAKSAFLAAMSHELRTPLNGVIGYSQILQADSRLAPDQHERVRIVQHSGEHLMRMINDVLDLAKIEAGKIELRPAPFPLGDLLRDIAASHTPAAARQGLAFAVDSTADLPAVVLGDAQKLRQVLDNLVGNAIKFTAAGGVTLRVSSGPVGGVPPPRSLAAGDPNDARGEGTPPTAPRSPFGGDEAPPSEIRSFRSASQLSALNSQLVFTVTDTGVGIAPEDQVRLFQPFEQANATRGDAPGTGLGLAISRALVARMGGIITLTSAAGRGSAFSFALPLPAVTAPPAPTAAARRITGYEGPARRVLVVDDHAINRRLVVDLLAPLGFTCGEFVSGEEALARLETGTEPWPDLLVLDVRMQGLDGLAVTRRLRALPRGGELKILLMSASVLSFDTAEGRRAGADEFLAKPFHAPDLFEKIAGLLDLHWREALPAAPSEVSGPSMVDAALPPAALAGLREALAHGDLDEFRRRLAVVRAAHPAWEARWSTLDAAAAAFHLSRLRELLEQP